MADKKKPAGKSGKKKPDVVDKNTATTRLRRYAKVSKTATVLAARVAGEKYLGLDIKREEHAKKLMLQLGALKGPLLKVAQLMATIPNALPKEYAQELQKLQAQAPSMGWLFVKRRMAAELGRDWEGRFKSFSRQAVAAASLGQVHRAVLPDGRDVACKLQYPDMAATVAADLKQLRVILGLFEKYDGAVVTDGIQAEVTARLYEELDYRLEAKHTALYADMLSGEKNVFVPDIVSGLSTGRLLTGTWLDGRPVTDYIDAPQKTRNDIAYNLFRAWYVPLYYYGVIHGDPHMGNYTVTDRHAVNLMDFGCVRVFPPRFIAGVITLYHALQTGKTDMAVAAYESWGFENLSKDTIETLNVWASFLYGPVLDDKVRRIGDLDDKGIYGRDIASQVHKALQQSGGVRVPREFVFMDRAALGLGSVFLRLRAEINWHDLFNSLIADFDVATLEKKQAAALKKHGLV